MPEIHSSQDIFACVRRRDWSPQPIFCPSCFSAWDGSCRCCREQFCHVCFVNPLYPYLTSCLFNRSVRAGATTASGPSLFLNNNRISGLYFQYFYLLLHRRGLMQQFFSTGGGLIAGELRGEGAQEILPPDGTAAALRPAPSSARPAAPAG